MSQHVPDCLGAGSHHSARLLAVRRSAGGWRSPFNVRSPDLAQRQREQSEERRAVERLKAQILADLYEAVPRTTSSQERGRLLRCQRSIYKGLDVSVDTLPACGSLRRSVCTYESRRLALLLATAELQRHEIASFKRRIDELKRCTVFQLACCYASPDLWADIQLSSDRVRPDLTTQDRGIAAYAAKFLIKANPQHLFTEVDCDGTEDVGETGARHEIVVALDLLMRVESNAVRDNPHHPNFWLAPAFQRDRCGTYVLLNQKGGRGESLIHLKANFSLDILAGFFAQRRAAAAAPVAAQHEWLAYATIDAQLKEDEAWQLVDSAVGAGLIQRYAVADFRDVSVLLAHLKADDWLRPLISHHLKRLTTTELITLDASLPAVTPSGLPKSAQYFVNTYFRSSRRFDRVVAEAAPYLAQLRPLFANQEAPEWRRRLQQRLCRLCQDRGTQRLPYLDVLRGVAKAVIDEPVREQRPRSFQHLCGKLSAGTVDALVQAASAAHVPNSICFRGPIDPTAGAFYLEAALEGGGRFVGRYHLARERRDGAEETAKVWQVELVARAPRNLNLVAPAYDTGCGFEARWSHRYSRWLDPEDIDLIVDSGGVRYAHSRTDRAIAFSYRGLMLARFLPVSLQLLLLSHRDTYDNPFRAIPPAEVDGVQFTKGVSFGPVHLRRDTWWVPKDLVQTWLRGNAVDAAGTLRAALPRPTNDSAEQWFVTTYQQERQHSKPRFVDTANVATVIELSRACQREWTVAAFSRCEPSPECWPADDDAHFTELLIEA